MTPLVTYLTSHPGKLSLAILPWVFAISTGNYCHRCWRKNGEFCVTVGLGPGLLAYWPSRWKAPAVNWPGNLANAGSHASLTGFHAHQLHVPPFRLSTVGRRSFPVAAATLWNTLPVDVQSPPSLPVVRQHLKTFLFHKSFPDVVWQADYAFVDLVMAYCYFSHVKNFLIDWLANSAAKGTTRSLATDLAV